MKTAANPQKRIPAGIRAAWPFAASLFATVRSMAFLRNVKMQWHSGELQWRKNRVAVLLQNLTTLGSACGKCAGPGSTFAASIHTAGAAVLSQETG